MAYAKPNRGFVIAAELARAYPKVSSEGIARIVKMLQVTAKAHRDYASRDCHAITQADKDDELRCLRQLATEVEAEISYWGEPIRPLSFGWGTGGSLTGGRIAFDTSTYTASGLGYAIT